MNQQMHLLSGCYHEEKKNMRACSEKCASLRNGKQVYLPSLDICVNGTMYPYKSDTIRTHNFCFVVHYCGFFCFSLLRLDIIRQFQLLPSQPGIVCYGSAF